MQQFFQAAGVPDGAAVSQVLFKSGGEGPVALAGGHVDFAAQQLAEAYGLVQDKKIRALAVIADKRLPQLPNVPTAAEAGFPNLDVVGWHGLSGPPGLPKHVVEVWVKTLREAANDPVFIEMMSNLQKVPVFLGPDELKAHVDKEYEKYLEVAKRMGWRK
jgi:tripartite-type tricarboxylate transporter receptor subunit TctC